MTATEAHIHVNCAGDQREAEGAGAADGGCGQAYGDAAPDSCPHRDTQASH